MFKTSNGREWVILTKAYPELDYPETYPFLLAGYSEITVDKVNLYDPYLDRAIQVNSSDIEFISFDDDVSTYSAN